MRKKIFQKLKKFFCYFFICFSLNFRSVKATENNITYQTTIIRCPGSMFKRRLFRIRTNKNQNNIDEHVEIKTIKGKRLGGILSGTTYEKFQKHTLVWLDDFGKNEKLILSKVQSVNIPPKIESISTKFSIIKKENDKKIKEFFFRKVFEKICDNFQKKDFL